MNRILMFVLFGLFTTLVSANPKTVLVYWPFSVSSPQGMMTRNLIEEANIQQSKYRYVFMPKPGAGGSIAANAIRTPNELSILVSTSSFYIRPLLYKDSHEVDAFKIAGTICMGQPLALFSKKLSSLPETSTSVGVIPGSITTLVARTLQKENPRLKVLEIPYKSTTDATTDMIGGHVDVSVDFVGKQTMARLDSSVNILGISGNKNHGSLKTFGSQKIAGLEGITNDYFIFVINEVDATIRAEINKIFSTAINEKVKVACEDEFGTAVSLPVDQLDKLHQSNKVKWQKATSDIIKE